MLTVNGTKGSQNPKKNFGSPESYRNDKKSAWERWRIKVVVLNTDSFKLFKLFLTYTWNVFVFLMSVYVCTLSKPLHPFPIFLWREKEMRGDFCTFMHLFLGHCAQILLFHHSVCYFMFVLNLYSNPEASSSSWWCIWLVLDESDFPCYRKTGLWTFNYKLECEPTGWSRMDR